MIHFSLSGTKENSPNAHCYDNEITIEETSVDAVENQSKGSETLTKIAGPVATFGRYI
jgi:hypothetical protein